MLRPLLREPDTLLVVWPEKAVLVFNNVLNPPLTCLLALDVVGSKYTKDIAYLEVLSRHRNIMPLYDLQPIILYDTYIAPNATLIGEVFVGAQTTVWYGATLRADINAIRYNFHLKFG